MHLRRRPEELWCGESLNAFHLLALYFALLQFKLFLSWDVERTLYTPALIFKSFASSVLNGYGSDGSKAQGVTIAKG